MNKPHEAAVVEARAEPAATPGGASTPGPTPGVATTQGPTLRVGVPHPHESAHLHVAGEATYVDDMPELAGTLHAALGLSPVAHGRLGALSLDAIAALPGVVDVFSARDIPGRNDCGPIVH
ncbi:MAG TPA: xanthine dehydrogenase molybdopterin binding subunit, partial [Burkholderiaceae bacterium]|nr:xanthine dehydrogenase molybdopterin binding subunit [Burkholderiaceae bacterium]